MHYLQSSEKGIRFPIIGVMHGFEPSRGSWGSKQGLLKEKPEFLNIYHLSFPVDSYFFIYKTIPKDNRNRRNIWMGKCVPLRLKKYQLTSYNYVILANETTQLGYSWKDLPIYRHKYLGCHF